MGLKIKNLSYMRVLNVYMLIFTTITNYNKYTKKTAINTIYFQVFTTLIIVNYWANFTVL